MRVVPWLDRAVRVIALVILVQDAASGGWLDQSEHAVGAVALERAATAPLYGIVASVATLLPAGEPAFRLGVLNAALAALVLVGVLRAARALLPKDPIAGLAPVVLLAIAQPMREAAAFAGPHMLAAAGLVWAIAFALTHARAPSPRLALAAFACGAITIGAAPWLGAALVVALVVRFWRTVPRPQLVLAAACLGVLAIAWWIGAVGMLPVRASSLSRVVAATSHAAPLVGIGLLGAAFALATGLASARTLVVAIAIAAIHAIAIDPDPTPVLALLAIAGAVIPAAVVRVIPERRHLVAAVAGLPLVVVALLATPLAAIDDPAGTPARLATDLLDDLPPGPGLMVATRTTTWTAIHHAQVIAGARPDLQLTSPAVTDGALVGAMRGGLIAGADVPSIGRLDPRLAQPRGRGFQLLLDHPTETAPVPQPASYATPRGAEQAALLAIDRGRYEAIAGRLDLAARATGLAPGRFSASDLAILATAVPTPERPALFQFIPALEPKAAGPWLLALFGDDLAWVAGLPQAVSEYPVERRLHALWREVWGGTRKPDDPAIAALGPLATAATKRMLDTIETTRR
ncbi:MAG: hypothetical protein WKG01_01275 [Kofleriaceae bacterium]